MVGSLREFTELTSLDIGQESLLGLRFDRPDQSLDRPLTELVDTLPASLRLLIIRYCDPSIESWLMEVAAVRAEVLPYINHISLGMACSWVNEELLRQTFQGAEMVFRLRFGRHSLLMT